MVVRVLAWLSRIHRRCTLANRHTCWWSLYSAIVIRRSLWNLLRNAVVYRYALNWLLVECQVRRHRLLGILVTTVVHRHYLACVLLHVLRRHLLIYPIVLRHHVWVLVVCTVALWCNHLRG